MISLVVIIGSMGGTVEAQGTIGATSQMSTSDTSISGDEVCGASSSTKCGISDLKKISGKLLSAIVTLGLPLLIVFIVYRFVMAWFALRSGNAGAYKEAVKEAGNAALGFLIIVALFGGLFFVVLKFFGISNFLLKPLQTILGMLVPHAYAADQQYLPNPLGVTNLYDFILLAVRFAVRFFLYPALIVIWVWSGFSFVLAQGNPEGLKNARKWLLWAFVTTIVVFMVQSFLLALQGSVKKILPNSGVTNSVSNSTTTDQYKPKDGEPGSGCVTTSGLNGQTAVDGTCVAGGRR